MKNIHILPTDKPSRLAYYQESTSYNEPILQVMTITTTRNDYKHQNLYITSDEEIKAKEYILIIREGLLIGKLGEIVLIESTKEGRTDYIRMDGNRGWFASDVNYQKDWNYKKIILTTDLDLIKDGVQEIDDEFLEWFIENPNCEEVELMSLREIGRNEYEIIIPEEKVKQDLEKEMFELEQEIPEDIANAIVFLAGDMRASYSMDKFGEEMFKIGAKWQKQQMYTEEEVYKIAKNAFELYRNDNLDDNELEQEFERVIKIWLKKK